MMTAVSAGVSAFANKECTAIALHHIQAKNSYFARNANRKH